MLANIASETDFLVAAGRLPAAPRLLVDLGRIIGNLGVSSEEVVAKLRQDPAVVARLIQVANSAVYARAEAVGSIEEAVTAIGFREVHRLVGAIASSQLAEQSLTLHGIESDLLRANSLFVAVVMEELAEAAGEDPRSCYTAGLLRSIGKMALNYIANDTELIPKFACSNETEVDIWENKYWGVDNCQVAETILNHWRLPHETVSAIRHHCRPGSRQNPVLHLLNLAAGAAEDRFFGLPGESSFWRPSEENFAKAGINQRGFQIACERAQRTFERLHAAVA